MARSDQESPVPEIGTPGLATAITMYREMGMTYWFENASQRLGQ